MTYLWMQVLQVEEVPALHEQIEHLSEYESTLVNTLLKPRFKDVYANIYNDIVTSTVYFSGCKDFVETESQFLNLV